MSMKLPDTNLLIHAANPLSPDHPIARHALDEAVREPAGIGLAWLPLVGFLRVSTMARVMPNPLSVADALADVQGWLGHPNARLLQPGARHIDILARLLLECGTAGNLTNDAPSPPSPSSTTPKSSPSTKISRSSPAFAINY